MDAPNPQIVSQVIPTSEPATFDKLTVLFRARIVRYLARRVPPDVAEELAQDVFLAAYQNFDSFRDHRAIEHWLFRIATNRLTDYYRSRARRAAVISLDQLNSDYLPGVQQNQGNGRPSQVEDQVWVEQVLAIARRVCSAIQFTVLCLYYQSGSLDEVAALLNMPSATVRSHFLRGRGELLSHLIAQEPEFVGGRDAIEQTIEKLKREADSPETFSSLELQALAEPRRWAKAFRSACVKIARHLPNPHQTA
ncbi:MAG TPA: sigma-70 family RNA polymerase sigma factor [Chthonomonadaceae bacterium]|nr:sigma-70 family RNA polymerase sigma factor [Chthonomonadaceae bacterium]